MRKNPRRRNIVISNSQTVIKERAAIVRVMTGAEKEGGMKGILGANRVYPMRRIVKTGVQGKKEVIKTKVALMKIFQMTNTSMLSP